MQDIAFIYENSNKFFQTFLFLIAVVSLFYLLFILTIEHYSK